LLGFFLRGDIRPDGYILIGLALFIQKRNNRRIHPINGLVFGSVLQLAFPNISASDGHPQISDKFFWVITGVNDPVVFAQQLFPTVFRYFAEVVVDILNDSFLIGNSYNRRLVKSIFIISDFFEALL